MSSGTRVDAISRSHTLGEFNVLLTHSLTHALTHSLTHSLTFFHDPSIQWKADDRSGTRDRCSCESHSPAEEKAGHALKTKNKQKK